jgi:CRP/FNR family transcriptional regulator/CRP/FNR family nitrogen fixation transcriptional regulator
MARPAELDTIRLIGATMSLARDQEVFGEGEPADYVYSVVRGAVRGFRVLSDGRRQICDFYLPGDLFGIEPGDEHRATAEALTSTVLVVARRRVLGEDSDTGAARRLWVLAMTELARSQDHAVTLGRRSASERVASFLMDMAQRLGSEETIELPMSRQDIADYLGLTIETVSRTFTHFQASGLISLSGCRCIHLRRRRALAELCN